jgi:hypothetical protein
MRSLLNMAAVVTAAIALAGCPYHRDSNPVPGPQSAGRPAAAVSLPGLNSRYNPLRLGL